MNERKNVTLGALVAIALLTAGCNDEARTQPLADLVQADPQAEPTARDAPAAPLEDGEIRAAIQHAYAIDPAVGATGVDVQVEDGIATLVGSTRHLLAREQAVTIAENVRGVRSVVDRLKVAPGIRADASIEEDVATALLFDPATERHELEISVEDGVVRVRGQVQSWAESSLVESVVSAVRGVRGVQNDVTIAIAAARSDEELEHEIEGRLRYDALVDARRIEVEVDDAVVELSGSVSSAGERTRASARAWVEGAKKVNAQALKVDYWSRDHFKRPAADIARATDDQLEDAVEDALRQDPRVGHFKIDVDVDRGMASLDGWVTNLLARQAAERDARNTAGVLGVYNFLRVVPDAEVPDDELQKRVAALIARDPYLGHGTVHALVEGGTVYLVGAVDSRFERRHAEELVGRLNGVVHLDIALKLRPSLTMLDAELERNIERGLEWDARVADAKVEVSVADGVATLRGQVQEAGDTRRILQRAYDAGARKVRNQLLVAPEPLSAGVPSTTPEGEGRT